HHLNRDRARVVLTELVKRKIPDITDAVLRQAAASGVPQLIQEIVKAAVECYNVSVITHFSSEAIAVRDDQYDCQLYLCLANTGGNDFDEFISKAQMCASRLSHSFDRVGAELLIMASTGHEAAEIAQKAKEERDPELRMSLLESCLVSDVVKERKQLVVAALLAVTISDWPAEIVKLINNPKTADTSNLRGTRLHMINFVREI